MTIYIDMLVKRGKMLLFKMHIFSTKLGIEMVDLNKWR